MTKAELLELLSDDTPCASINTLRDIHSDQELMQRGVMKFVKVGEKNVKIALPPLTMRQTQEKDLVDLPTRGFHTDSILEDLDYTFEDINLLLTQTKRCGDILKKLSQDTLAEDNFLDDIKLDELLNEIARSYREISNKKLSVIVEKNEINPRIERTLEITYGLRNFIGNAVKYSKSLVEIRLESNNKITEVKVCDDGPGFPSDVKDILGEPYIRSEDDKISSKSGLGLGTFIGKTLLERMKANVTFDKCPKTNGAMVTIQWQTNSLLSI